jgi:hypothetical protein
MTLTGSGIIRLFCYVYRAETFYWRYVHVPSAFSLARHYRAVLAWGP